MQRVVMIVDSAPPLYGGAGRQAALLADQLSARGEYEIEIWARRRSRAVKGHHGRVRFVGPYVRFESLSNIIFALLCAVKLLAAKVDLVHVHGAYYYGLTSLVVARLKRKPSILKITLLGSDDPRSLRQFSKAGIPIGRLLAKQFDLATRVIALNKEARAACESVVEVSKVEVIPNGVEFPNEVRDRGEDIAPAVVFVGVFSARKGADTLLSGWPSFRAEYPESTLRVVGPVRFDLDHEVRLSSSGVELIGQVGTDRVRSELQNANLFILPSRAEGLPNAAIEAMSYSLPLVLSDIEVNRSTASEAAVYFDPDSPEDLAKALGEAWTRRRDLSELSYKCAKQYDIGNTADSYRDLYSEIL